mmetsp:Transcript_5330/g.18950  ORF Transcript_5330/g.18950 Transcript_5330/m.18950 type:complete len:253 (-) Transcript_5330:1414-2172(-)
MKGGGDDNDKPKVSAPGFGLNTPIVAVLLCALSTLQAMAAIMSKEDGQYPYKVIGSTLLSEAFKFLTSGALLIHEIWKSGEHLSTARSTTLATTPSSLMMAAVPGIAYQVLNNLNFVTLYYVDAPTFQILGNLKIVATGIAGQVLLHRYLSKGKWLALTLLTLGAAISQIPQPKETGAGVDCEAAHWFAGRSLGYVSALICVFLSPTASSEIISENHSTRRRNDLGLGWRCNESYEALSEARWGEDARREGA